MDKLTHLPTIELVEELEGRIGVQAFQVSKRIKLLVIEEEKEEVKIVKGSTEMIWRRFEIIAETKEEENKFLEVLERKNLSREDLMLILNSIKVRNA